VKLFDDRTGEWLAEITEAGKKRVTLRVVRHLREREPVPDLWLLFAPIKRGRSTGWSKRRPSSASRACCR
jgi:16S rRNA (uracil1498-N3)-methyltransferase